MAYDRYDARRDGRESRSRWQGDDRFERGGWSRDRDSTLAGDPRFGAVSSKLWNMLRGESLRAMGQQTEAKAA